MGRLLLLLRYFILYTYTSAYYHKVMWTYNAFCTRHPIPPAICDTYAALRLKILHLIASQISVVRRGNRLWLTLAYYVGFSIYYRVFIWKWSGWVYLSILFRNKAEIPITRPTSSSSCLHCTHGEGKFPQLRILPGS